MNTKIPKYELLDYLHDAIMIHIRFFVDEDGLRRCEMIVYCDEDCGYEPWAGCVVNLLFRDVLIFCGSLFGHVNGPEQINIIRQGLAPGAAQSVTEMIVQGVREPNTRLSIIFQSGSELALACDSIEVTIQRGSDQGATDFLAD